MKKVLIIITLGMLFAFQKPSPTQFFVEGYIETETQKTVYNVTLEYNAILEKEFYTFTSRYDLLVFMNLKGFKCVSHSFNTYRSVGQEFFIFE